MQFLFDLFLAFNLLLKYLELSKRQKMIKKGICLQ